MAKKHNSMKEYFDKIIPDNIKTDTPILYESFHVFLDSLDSKRELVSRPNDILDLLTMEESEVARNAGIDSKILRDDFTSIYLRHIFDGIKESVNDYTITSKISNILALYNIDEFQGNESLIDSSSAITDETVMTGKELSQTKGSFKSYDYTFRIMKELNIVKILSSFNEYFLRTHEGKFNEHTKEYDKEPFVYSIESSVSSIIFDRVLRKILHPVGFEVIYKAIISSLFEDNYSYKATVRYMDIVIACRSNPEQIITKIAKDSDGNYRYEEDVRIYNARTVTVMKAWLDDAPIQTIDGIVLASYIEKDSAGDIHIYVGNDHETPVTTFSGSSCLMYANIEHDYEFLLADKVTDYQNVLSIDFWDKHIHYNNLETDWLLFNTFKYGSEDSYNFNFFVYKYKDNVDYYHYTGIEDTSKLVLLERYKDVSISPEDYVASQYGNHIARVIIVKDIEENLNDGLVGLVTYSGDDKRDLFNFDGSWVYGGINSTFITKRRYADGGHALDGDDDGVVINGGSASSVGTSYLEREYHLETDSDIDTDLIFDIDISVNIANGDTTFSGTLFHFADGTPLSIKVTSLEHSFENTEELIFSTISSSITNGMYSYTVPGLLDANYTVEMSGTNLLALDMVTKKDFVVNWQD